MKPGHQGHCPLIRLHREFKRDVRHQRQRLWRCLKTKKILVHRFTHHRIQPGFAPAKNKQQRCLADNLPQESGPKQKRFFRALRPKRHPQMAGSCRLLRRRLAALAAVQLVQNAREADSIRSESFVLKKPATGRHRKRHIGWLPFCILHHKLQPLLGQLTNVIDLVCQRRLEAIATKPVQFRQALFQNQIQRHPFTIQAQYHGIFLAPLAIHR